jgi:hypothetical protein
MDWEMRRDALRLQPRQQLDSKENARNCVELPIRAMDALKKYFCGTKMSAGRRRPFRPRVSEVLNSRFGRQQ